LLVEKFLNVKMWSALSQPAAAVSALDVLVNSAGVLVTGDTLSLSMDEYDRCMNINTRSVFVMTQACLPHLIKSKGNIVNVSSVAGLRSFPGVVAYNMSKAALDQLTRTVALEVAAKGVRVNAVNPGVIVTNVHKNAGMDSQR
jgi:NAD(P)-dependent dehydrogenase (short-subunit alcohol dehydrogenase family)